LCGIVQHRAKAVQVNLTVSYANRRDVRVLTGFPHFYKKRFAERLDQRRALGRDRHVTVVLHAVALEHVERARVNHRSQPKLAPVARWAVVQDTDRLSSVERRQLKRFGRCCHDLPPAR